MDPIAATVQKEWIWRDGGSYFGILVSNYLGWLLCVYSIFQVFALYIARRPANPDVVVPDGRSYWYQAVTAYLKAGLCFVLNRPSDTGVLLTDATKETWRLYQILRSVVLVGIFTMGFVALLSALLISKRFAQSGAGTA